MYKCTKTYATNEGLSCCFRQWRATHSHCQYLHGYALSFKIVFGCSDLDERNWVQDYGGLKQVKSWLKDTFDHTLCVAADDPKLETFQKLADEGLVQLRVLHSVGCEAMAKHVFDFVERWLKSEHPTGRVWVESVEVSEHNSNAASYHK